MSPCVVLTVGTEITPGPDDIRGPDGSEPSSRSETVHFFINSRIYKCVLADMKPVEGSENGRDVIHSLVLGPEQQRSEHEHEHVGMSPG